MLLVPKKFHSGCLFYLTLLISVHLVRPPPRHLAVTFSSLCLPSIFSHEKRPLQQRVKDFPPPMLGQILAATSQQIFLSCTNLHFYSPTTPTKEYTLIQKIFLCHVFLGKQAKLAFTKETWGGINAKLLDGGYESNVVGLFLQSFWRQKMRMWGYILMDNYEGP